MNLLEELASVEECDEYDKLPHSIKSTFSRKEWAWLSEDQKANLSIDELEPECYE